MPEIKYTRLYTILAINFKDQISIPGFLSRKIRSVFDDGALLGRARFAF
jgi:hypothetical protein